MIQLTGSQEVDSILGKLSYALHNVFLLVVTAAALTLTINLFSWALGGPGPGYQGYEDYAGYPGYSGYPGSYMAGEKRQSQPGLPHLLGLLSPEALTGLLETIKTGGGLGGLGAVSRMGSGEAHLLRLLF